MTAATTSLQEWRDAAVTGGLPQPSRADRWQPLRAGVVNLWEFDVAEVWYADGRLQLQGANESGKSTLMTLTTLLLLHGEVHGRNIDTLGESGKRFRYYVEPTEHQLDRRDASKQRQRGWAWMEYGRATATGPEFFTSALCAEARRGDPSVKLQWCTLHGQRRVRDGLTLAAAGLPTEPGQVRDLPGLVLHRTASAYREETARILFGTDTGWLEQIVRVLRVLRTPKIGDRLDLTFLTEAFRRALPPLAEDEVHQLASGWEQLDRLRSDRDHAEQALAAVAEFTRQRWRPWADAVIRAAADPVTATNDALDNVTRQERESALATAKLAEQVETADAGVESLRTEQEDARARREALQQEQAYQDAVAAANNARQLTERAGAAAELAARSADRESDADADLTSAHTGREEAQRWLTDAEREVTIAAERVAGHADPAGLVEETARFLPGRDVARLRHAAQHRAGAVDRALQLWHEQASATDQAEVAAGEAARARARADASREEADRAGRRVEESVTAVGERLSAWARALPEPIRPASMLVERWGRAVAGIADAATPEPVLTAAVAGDHLRPVRRPLEEARAGLAQQLADNRVAQEGAERELAAVEAERDPRPREPELWRRRPRPPGIAEGGAPLWRLVEVRAGADPAALSVLEAALEAAGLLQAWVTPDGVYRADRDAAETVWLDAAASPPASHRARTDHERVLRAVLRPADDAGALSTVVDRLLGGVPYLDNVPPEETPGAAPAIGRDGSWRHGTLTGTAPAPADGPRLLGAAARAADRARRIASLHRQLAELARQREPCQAELAATQQLLDTLDRAGAPPPDAPVVGAVLELRAAERRAADDVADADLAAAAARTAMERVDAAAATLAAHADEHRLPRGRDRVESVRHGVAEFLAVVGGLETAGKSMPPAQAAVERAGAAFALAEQAHRRAGADRERDRSEAHRLRRMADAATAALAKDAQQILVEVAQLGSLVTVLDRSIKEAQQQRDQLMARKLRAEADLTQVAGRRQVAEESRRAAVESWFGCVDTGLPRLCGLAEPVARHVTAALESARAARATVTPRDWPRDPAEATGRVQRAWQRMLEDLLTLRSRLEALGGRTARAVSPADDDAAAHPPGFPGAVEVVVDGTGVATPPPEAAAALAALVTRLRRDYDEELTRTINELLGSTFIEHLRDRLTEAERLRQEINGKLSEHPTITSGLRLRLERVPVAEENAANQVLYALERDFGLLASTVQDQIRAFLARRVDDAQEQARAVGDPDWRARLAETLDYRRWFDLRLEFRARHGDGSRWQPLDRGNHTLLSGGAKVVTLLQPFVAALHAMYDQSRTGPRMMWLDEAFDGVDPDNRATLLRLLTECDIDWLIAGPGPIANAPTVPLASVYEVRRALGLQPGVSLELAVWAGGELTHLATPDPADLPDLAIPVPPPAPPGDDLLSGLVH